jgi:hypothetical protein
MSGGRARNNLKAEHEVELALRQLEVQAVNFAYRFIKDSTVRQDYIAKTRAFSEQILASYRSGALSAKQAAEAAHQMRNEIMEFARTRSSDLGRAKAQSLKAQGLDFDDLAEKYALRKFRNSFRLLTEAQQTQIYLEIAEAAGRANPRVNASAARLGAVGRGLWMLSAVVAVYNVGTAEYKGHALGREASNIGGGFAGGAAGGAVAGIWLGPVGVAFGVVIGGVLGSITADQAYIEITGPRDDSVRKILPRFTRMFHVDEAGIAKALVEEVGIDLDAVLAVFRELDRSYSSDSDDVAVLYLNLLRSNGHTAIIEGLRLHNELRAFLIHCLETGWTSKEEKALIGYLRSLTAVQ